MNIHHLGKQEYNDTWLKMKEFTIHRLQDTTDELWFLEHYPVYTQGQAGKAEHILNHTAIPIVQSDRGGQVTYHGPGQLVVYVLMNLPNRSLGIRALVTQLEHILINTLLDFDIKAEIRCGAPGVYVNDKKIASIGLRVKNGCTYHGIALNVTMDLSPFNNINPCGFAQMEMTQISHFIPEISLGEVSHRLEHHFIHHFESSTS